MKRSTLQLLLAAHLLGSAPASRADEAIRLETIDVSAEREERDGDEERERLLDETAFRTSVAVADHEGEGITAAELVAQGAGVQVRSLGGLGAFSALSVRGLSVGQTTVMLDGVALSRLASTGIDLGRFDLRSLDEIELYRGAAPAHLSSQGAGGVLNLISDSGGPPQLQLSAGGGSFGARHGVAGLRLRLGDKWHLLTRLSYRGAEGDYPFYDDNGTNLNLDDDTTSIRSNNAFDHGEALVRARYEGRRSALTLGSRTSLRKQGVPGYATVQSMRTSLSSVSQVLDGEYRHRGPRPGMEIAGAGFSLLEFQRYRDPEGEVGLASQDRRYRTLSLGGRLSLVAVLGSRHRLSAGLEARADGHREEERSGIGGERSSGSRWATALVASDEIFFLEEDRLVLQPSLRLDLSTTQPGIDLNGAAAQEAASRRNEFFPSPRLSFRFRHTPDPTLKGSTGLFFRSPTLVELFGDRGFIVGNPQLESEKGAVLDLGWVLAKKLRNGNSVFAELSGFLTRTSSVIAWSANAGGFAGAQNLGEATTLGVEASASLRHGRGTVVGNYTLLASRRTGSIGSFEGNRLPHKPLHQGYVRASVRGLATTFWSDLSVASGNYVDAANLVELPARVLVGAGAKLRLFPGLGLAVEARNLFDKRSEEITLSPAPAPGLERVPRPLSDYFGYPLPGRSFYVSVDAAHELADGNGASQERQQ